MATDAEARAAGFSTPAGTSLISGGDDAIRQNARTALDLTNAARFVKPFAGNTGDLNDLHEPGMHSYGGQWANRPNNSSGSVFVTPVLGGTARMQIAFPYGTAAGIYYRYYGAFWANWVRLDSPELPEISIPAAAPQQSPTTLKTVPVPLTVGGGIHNYPATQGGVRIPVNFSVPIKRWRLHLRNINPRQGTPGAGNVAISSVYLGRHGGNGTVTGGNTLIGGAMASSNGSDMVTPWSSAVIDSAYEYLISYGWTSTAQPKQVVGGGYTTATAGGAFSNAATTTRSVNLPLDAWIEAEVEADVPVIAGFGDSLTSGVGAVLPVFNSWLTAYCRTHKALPVHYSASGDTMAGWSDPDHYKWTRWDHLTRPDAVVHAMGSNDVFGGASLATMQDRFRHTIELLAEKVSPTVYAATIMPREGSAWDAMEQVRRDYNAWLAGRTRELFDFVGAVSLDDETLIDSIDSDGIHLTAAGYQAVAGAITGTLTSAALPATIARVTALDTRVTGLDTPVRMGIDNLNTLTEPCTFYQDIDSRATPENNYPAPWGGWGMVRRWSPSYNGLIQTYYPRIGAAVKRQLYNGSWGPWTDFDGDALTPAGVPHSSYASGRRNITSLIPGVVSGDLFVLRIGSTVSLEFSVLKLTPQAGSFIDLGNVIPDGFRISGDREFLEISQPVSGAAEGPIRLRRVGSLLIYGANNGEEIYGTVTYQTLNAPPATPPGDPA